MAEIVERTECTCKTCQSFCTHAPGWFLPGEAEHAAGLFQMSLPDFFRRYLQVDYWAADQDIYVLRPATTNARAGDVSGFNPRGRCVFYHGGRCDIHLAKPHECATAKHDVAPPSQWHESTAKAWEGDGQQEIAALYGDLPKRQEFKDMDDMFATLLEICK